ncbi:MAG: transglycosylase SLT domain-containing protein [Paracoccaceae bacterium]
MLRLALFLLVFPSLVFAQADTSALGSGISEQTRPVARSVNLPRTRWEHQSESPQWTRSALAAQKTHGIALPLSVPSDIADWCPTYEQADMAQRRAFWAGFLSALAKFESTYKPGAVGGGGQWFGLLQIQPSTARQYGCQAGSGQTLKNGAANVSCAIRIMAVTVPRDDAIAVKDGRWKGVAADWGPMRSDSKRRDMSVWLKRQTYCRPLSSVRPRKRP